MKPVFQALVALIAIAAVGALIISFSIDGMVKSNIQDTTSQLLETRVSVEDVSISILDGAGTITGFTIHNPEEFSDKPAIAMRKINLKMDIRSLLSDTVTIREMRIQHPDLYIEQTTSGNNLEVLAERLRSGSASDVQVVVDYLLVEKGELTLTSGIGGKRTVKGEIPRIEIEDIGRQGSNTLDQVLKQILEPIIQNAVEEAAKEGLLDRAEEEAADLLDG